MHGWGASSQRTQVPFCAVLTDSLDCTAMITPPVQENTYLTLASLSLNPDAMALYNVPFESKDIQLIETL